MREQFLAQLYQMLPQLKTELDTGWDDFSAELKRWLLRLLDEADPNLRQMMIDRIFRAGRRTPAAETFRQLYTSAKSPPVYIYRLQLRSGKEVTLEPVEPVEPSSSRPAMAEIAAAILVELETSGELSFGDAAGDTAQAGEAATLETAKDIAPPEPAGSARYLQAAFHSDHTAETMTAESPLALAGGPYSLTLHIGPGQGDVPFPEEAVKDEYQDDKLDIQVAVTTQGLAAALLDDAPVLTLPRQGKSRNSLRYRITPHDTGRGRLDIDLFYKGNLLQRRRIDIAVVARPGDPVPPSALPPQRQRTTYTIVGQLSQEAIARWEERVITLVVERDPHDDSYLINIHHGPALLCRYDCHQTDLSLRQLVPGLRQTLAELSKAFHTHPEPAAAKALLRQWLPWLAFQGRRLYHTLFRHSEAGNPAQTAPLGSVIQATPIGPRATLPWGLVYDRPFDRQGGLTRQSLTNPLCPAWLAGHDCLADGCPHAGEATIVCPSGFWGYRYIIEQIPAGLGQGVPGALPLIVKNGNGTHFNMNAFQFNDLPLAERPFRRLAAIHQDQAAPFTFDLNTTTAEFKTDLKRVVRAEDELHLLYFFAHGGKTAETDIPYLRLGSKNTVDYLARDTLDELGVASGTLPSRPLVFLNACESGNYTPDDYESFIEAFYQAGACGLIGTECIIWQQTARAMARGFFRHFLTGTPAGESLWLAGRDLLAQFNPLGLVYSLYASGLVRLAKKIPGETIETAWQETAV